VGGPKGTADGGIEDAGVDGGGRGGCPDDGPVGGMRETAVQARSTKAALPRNARKRRIAGLEATLQP
jgi:hypothetical protein